MSALNNTQLDQLRNLDVSGERQLIQKFLHAFLDSAERYMRQLEQALDDNDAEALYRAAHTFKSSAANIGAEDLSELLGQLEAFGKAGELVNAKSLQETVQQQYQLVINEVKEMLEKS